MGDFKKLHVWAKAHALAINTHRAAGRMRGRELAALRSQLVRAVMSIPANIVEGSRKRSARDFARFVGYSIDSAVETENHFLVARDIGALPKVEFASLYDQLMEVRRMLHGLRTRLESANPRSAGATAGTSTSKDQDEPRSVPSP